MWRVRSGSNPWPGRWVGYAVSQPSWVTRLALIAMVLVVVVPLAMLALAGLAVGLVVFVTLGLVARVVMMVRSALGRLRPTGRGDGRNNVRVIDRD